MLSPHRCLAQPEVRVVQGPLVSGNQSWTVQVKPYGQFLFENPNRPAPNPDFAAQSNEPRPSIVAGIPAGSYHESGALAVELSLTSSNAVVFGAHNATNFSTDPTVGNPTVGNNPFIQNLSEGVACGVAGCDGGAPAALGQAVAGMTANQIFIALGSKVFDPHAGDVNADSQTNIADAGVFGGNLNKNWSATPADVRFNRGRRVADYNGDNKVDIADAGVFGGGLNKTQWLDVATIRTLGAGGTLSLVELTVDPIGAETNYLSSRISQGGKNFDSIPAPGAGSLGLTGSGVPEPTSFLLLLLAVPALIPSRRRK